MGIQDDDALPPQPRRVLNRLGVTTFQVVMLEGQDYHGNDIEAMLQIITADDRVYRLKLERVW